MERKNPGKFDFFIFWDPSKNCCFHHFHPFEISCLGVPGKDFFFIFWDPLKKAAWSIFENLKFRSWTSNFSRVFQPLFPRKLTGRTLNMIVWDRNLLFHGVYLSGAMLGLRDVHQYCSFFIGRYPSTLPSTVAIYRSNKATERTATVQKPAVSINPNLLRNMEMI